MTAKYNAFEMAKEDLLETFREDKPLPAKRLKIGSLIEIASINVESKPLYIASE